MKFEALGGIREHGRNCFYIQGKNTSFLLDCGEGEKGEIPDFDLIHPEKIDYLYLSHSHLDHTGAIKEFYSRGFRGILLCSEDTYSLLKDKPSKVKFLLPNQETILNNSIHLLPRRSGHCFGSLSLLLTMEDRTVLYTGDYLEESIFQVDEIRNEKADLSIIDGCYSQERPIQENRKRLLDFIQETEGAIILPLPRNGRSMEIIHLLNKANIPYLIHQPGFYIGNESLYLKEEIEIRHAKEARIHLMDDPQLEKEESRNLISSRKDAALIFTGTIDEGSYAQKLLKERDHTYFYRINVHQTIQEAEKLIRENSFRKTVLFHNKELSQEKKISF